MTKRKTSKTTTTADASAPIVPTSEGEATASAEHGATADLAPQRAESDDMCEQIEIETEIGVAAADSAPDAESMDAPDAPEMRLDGDAETGEAQIGEAEVVDAESLDAATPAPAEGSHLESILESLLFAADRPLTLSDLKRLLGERDGKRVTVALEALRARRESTGIQLVSLAGGWQLRTHPANGAWVAKLVAGRPPRLSRAMMETLSIVAYRQPITRPEIDEIRGVDCGPVLKTLLDRALVRVIGKREEVGRPILYGTTPEFLLTFSLRDLTELPTLREFHELGADDQARVNAGNGESSGAAAPAAPVVASGDAAERWVPASAPLPGSLPDSDPAEEDSLLDELDQAAGAAGRASQAFTNPERADGSDGVASAGVAAPAADAAER